MEKPKIAVVGIGATGSVLAAALLCKYPETVLVGRRSDMAGAISDASSEAITVPPTAMQRMANRSGDVTGLLTCFWNSSLFFRNSSKAPRSAPMRASIFSS